MKFRTHFYIDLSSYLTKIRVIPVWGIFFITIFYYLNENYLKNLRFTTNITKKLYFLFLNPHFSQLYIFYKISWAKEDLAFSKKILVMKAVFWGPDIWDFTDRNYYHLNDQISEFTNKNFFFRSKSFMVKLTNKFY